MKRNKADAGLWRFEVWHPEYGARIVQGADKADAVKAAAVWWCAKWQTIAGDCRVTKLGTAARPRCRRCHREYGEAGAPAALCPECIALEERHRRDAAWYRPQREDRRVASDEL